MDFTTFPIFRKYFTLDQFRNQTLAILKEWTQDSRLLFDLDVYTILAEINDLYATGMLSKAIPQALPLESRFSLLTYYMYLVNLTVGSIMKLEYKHTNLDGNLMRSLPSF